jgi:intracellular sulfur oxidation DsrE/DsrF family protein
MVPWKRSSTRIGCASEKRGSSMANLMRKALSLFVDMGPPGLSATPKAEAEHVREAPATAAATVDMASVDPGVDLTSDPDYTQVQKAIGLLSEGVPPQAVLKTMRAFGQDPATLLSAFTRVQAILQTQITAESAAAAQRKQRNAEILAKLQEAIQVETQQCEAELVAHTKAIEVAQQRLVELTKVASLFTDAPTSHS